MAEQEQDDGIDVVKFFLGVMSLLTVFVAVFAAYNWSKAVSLAEEVENDEIELRSLVNLGKRPEFREMIARAKYQELTGQVTSQDFGLFLNNAAAKLNIPAPNKVPGPKGKKFPGWQKQSYKLTVSRASLDVIVSYLWYVQGNWPGLKVESLKIQPAKARRGQPVMGWEASFDVSIFKPENS